MKPSTYRYAGIAGLLFIALGFFGLGGPYYENPSRSEVVDWARDNHHAILIDGMLYGVAPLFFAVAVLAYIHRTGDRGPLALLAVIAVAADVVVSQITMFINFALADVASSDAAEGADDAVIALFSLAKHTDYYEAGVAAAVILLTSALAMRTRTLPRWLCWLGLVDGVVTIVGFQVQAIAFGRPDAGPSGFVGAMLGLVWVAAVSISLMRPRRATEEASGDHAPEAAFS